MCYPPNRVFSIKCKKTCSASVDAGFDYIDEQNLLKKNISL